VAEDKYAAVFEKTAHYRDHANVVRNSRNSGFQATNAPYAQGNIHPRLGSAIERVDRFHIDERVHFSEDARRLALSGELSLLLDLFENREAQCPWPGLKLPVFDLMGKP